MSFEIKCKKIYAKANETNEKAIAVKLNQSNFKRIFKIERYTDSFSQLGFCVLEKAMTH